MADLRPIRMATSLRSSSRLRQPSSILSHHHRHRCRSQLGFFEKRKEFAFVVIVIVVSGSNTVDSKKTTTMPSSDDENPLQRDVAGLPLYAWVRYKSLSFYFFNHCFSF